MEELALLFGDDATDGEGVQYGLSVADLKFLRSPGPALRGTPTFRPNDAHRILLSPYGIAVLASLIIAILYSRGHHRRANQ
jgi:hypothetical protein